jgi:signal transduction histidine kinase/CheY-like chemotaxis protein
MKNTFVPILLLVLLFFATVADANPVLPGIAHKGLLDLRKADFTNHDISLGGEWKLYWNRLLTPGMAPDTAAIYVNFPSLWKNIRANGKPLPSQGYATYELTVLLSPNKPVLGMEIPDVYSAYNLYINDTLLCSNGVPGKTPATSVPFWNTRTIRIFPDRDTLHLLMQVSNFWHTKGGTYKAIEVGVLKTLGQKRDREMAYDLVLMGCLFMGGLFFLGLYFFGRKDKAILYFSLFCILYSYRMIGTDRYVLHTLFPSFSWFIAIRLEYLVLSAGVAMFVQYSRHLFPKDSNQKIMNGMLAFCICFTLIVIFSPPIVFTSFLEWFLGAMFICIAYASFVYIQAARHKREGSAYALLGAGIMMLIFLLSNLNYFGVISPVKGWVFGFYLLFFFLQSLALSHRFAQSFRQATLEAHQGLKTKSEFLSTMSHEIRTPLNAVIGMTYVLLQKEPRKDQQEHLDVLLFSANNLLSIVNNILDYNKIEAGKINFEHIPMDIAVIAKNITASLKATAEEKSVKLRSDIDPLLKVRVKGDPTRFSQVLTNLLHNAVKFTREGEVCLKMKVVSLTPEMISVTISVEDTGIGIDADKQSMIFESFSQAESSTSRSYGGTGLGLAISKKILQLQDIELQLESTPGKGSRFYFTQSFPLTHEKTEAVEEKKEKRLEGISILLVEDQPFNVMLAKAILEGWGAIIDVANNGLEALERLDTSRHRLILMDLHMPVMDGYEATERLRARGETLPIIALTASTPGEVEAGTQKAGLTDIVVKPFNPDDLYRVIVHYLS